MPPLVPSAVAAMRHLPLREELVRRGVSPYAAGPQPTNENLVALLQRVACIADAPLPPVASTVSAPSPRLRRSAAEAASSTLRELAESGDLGSGSASGLGRRQRMCTFERNSGKRKISSL